MRKISFTFQRPQISINGELYDVLRSDAGILQDLLDLDAQFENRDMQNTETVLDRHRAMLDYLDKLLGAGAAERIVASTEGMAGYDLGLAGVQALVESISSAAMNAYSEAIKAKYDD